MWCRFIALLTQLFWMQWPHSAHTHSAVSTPPTNEYSEVIIVHACTFQSTSLSARLHGCHTDRSHYFNNGWNFPGQTSYLNVSCYLSIFCPNKKIYQVINCGCIVSHYIPSASINTTQSFNIMNDDVLEEINFEISEGRYMDWWKIGKEIAWAKP